MGGGGGGGGPQPSPCFPGMAIFRSKFCFGAGAFVVCGGGPAGGTPLWLGTTSADM